MMFPLQGIVKSPAQNANSRHEGFTCKNDEWCSQNNSLGPLSQ